MAIFGSRKSASTFNNKSCSMFCHCSSTSSVDRIPSFKVIPNPNPSNYEILSNQLILTRRHHYLILEIKYLDVNNFEGIKILVFRDVSLLMLEKQQDIDPHFSDNKQFHSPIARFIPTEEGMLMALEFCKSMKLKEDFR